MRNSKHLDVEVPSRLHRCDIYHCILLLVVAVAAAASVDVVVDVLWCSLMLFDVV